MNIEMRPEFVAGRMIGLTLSFFPLLLKAKSIISQVEVPKSMLLNAILQESDPLVAEMRKQLLKVSPNFFSLDDLPAEPMGPPSQLGSNRGASDNAADQLKMHPNFVLSLWYTLKQLRDPKSKWRPYLDLLPQSIPTPLFWNEKELEIIEGTNLYEGVDQLKALLRKVWRTLNQVDPLVTLEDVHYGYALFSSRAFAVSTDVSKEEVHTHIMAYNQSDAEAAVSPALVEACLVPYADIFNHSATARVQFRTNHILGSFNLDLETLAQDGQEVFNNYGFKSNESLILGYGFSLPPGENPHNSYWVQVNIAEADPDRKQKFKLIKSQKLAFRHFIKQNGFIPDELLQVMRICLLDQLDLYFIDQPALPNSDSSEVETNGKTGPSGSSLHIPFSFEREMLLFDTLNGLLHTRLSKMEPTPAHLDREAFDSACASTADLSWPTIMGWQYRIEQKETLLAAIKRVAEMRDTFLSESKKVPILDQDIVPPPKSYYEHLPEEWKARFTAWSANSSAVSTSNGASSTSTSSGLSTAMTIPMEWVICADNIRKSTLGMLLKAGNVLDDLDEEMLLAIFILFNLHTPGQPYHDYFQSIAKSQGGRPRYLNALAFNDCNLLQGTPAENSVAQTLDSYEQEYRRSFCGSVKPLHANFQDQNMFAWKHFVWAYDLISCEGLLLPGDEPQLAIIPSFGVRSFHPQETCELDLDEAGNVVVLSSKIGNNVWFSGCAMGRNDEMLRTFGVVVLNHNMNVIQVPLYAEEEDALVDMKMGLLAKLRLDADHFLDGLHVPQRLIDAVTILNMEYDELENLNEAVESHGTDAKIRAKSTSKSKALDVLQMTLGEMKSMLSDSIEAHQAELKSTDESETWILNRLNVVLAYKRMLLADILEPNTSYLATLSK
jgi:hypothetical protein